MPSLKQRTNSHFKRGSGLFTCRSCHRKTRSTGGDGADLHLCDQCYDLAGEDNHLSDNGKLYDSISRVAALFDQLTAAGVKNVEELYPSVWRACHDATI